MKLLSLLKKDTKDEIRINILNTPYLTKHQKKQIAEIVTDGINSKKELRDIATYISSHFNLKSVQIYRRFNRIDIVI